MFVLMFPGLPRGTLGAMDWSIQGVIVDALEVPFSGGAWSITILTERRETGGEQYIQLWCDHEQKITKKKCARARVGMTIKAAGYINSNEPFGGQRLSVRSMEKENERK